MRSVPLPVNRDSTIRDEDCLRRLTHVIVLHWHVWSDLVYLAPGMDDDDSDFSDDQSAACSASASPTMPVAEAIYGNNRKFLLLALTVKDVDLGITTPGASPAPGAEHDHTTTASLTMSGRLITTTPKPFSHQQQPVTTGFSRPQFATYPSARILHSSGPSKRLLLYFCSL